MTDEKIIVDCRGLYCPEPLLQARAALRAHPLAEIVVWATDPLAELDLRALAARSGWLFAEDEARADARVMRLRRATD